jgi:manganese peroxidase
MRSTFFVAALAGTAFAYPKGAMKDLFKAVAKRGEFAGSTELWGEWKSGGPKEIKSLLQGKGSGISYDGYRAPEMDSDECKKDKCCIWHYITAELYGLMHDDASNTCNDFARAAVRMGFHDAASWTADLSSGGADGSLLLAGELSRFENGGGIGTNAPTLIGIFDKYESYGISMADLIQAASKVGTLACPGGPRIRMFVGRTDSTDPAPEGLLPSPFVTADDAIEMFGKKTVSPGGLIALLGAHTASINHAPFVGPLGPQDLTPGKWDTTYFTETLKTNASEGVTRFISDTNLAQSEVTKGSFEFFEGNKGAWDQVRIFL